MQLQNFEINMLKDKVQWLHDQQKDRKKLKSEKREETKQDRPGAGDSHADITAVLHLNLNKTIKVDSALLL